MSVVVNDYRTLNPYLEERYTRRLGSLRHTHFEPPEHDLATLDLSSRGRSNSALQQDTVIKCCAKYAANNGFERLYPTRHLLLHSPDGSLEECLKVNIWGEKSGACQRFMNIGAYVICDPRLRGSMPTYALPYPTLFTAESEDKALLKFHHYTWPIIALLNHSSLKGLRLVDLGSGQGVLSITAKLFGADRVILLDNNCTALAEAARLCRSHGLKKHSDFFTIRSNLRSRWRVAGILRSTGDPQKTAVALNLGIWPSDYTIDNYVLFPVLKRLADRAPRYVFLGGYARDRRAEDTKIISSEVREMKELGYRLSMAASSFSLNPRSNRACPGGAALLFEKRLSRGAAVKITNESMG